MTVGERIKTRRKELGMTVDELAEKLGKNRATVYRYERDDIENLPASVLAPLAEALETTPDDLMGWYEDFLNDCKEQYQKVNQIIPYITYGVSVYGEKEKFVVLKTDAKGGERQQDMTSLLVSIHRLNLDDRQAVIHDLPELIRAIDTFDPCYMDQIINYANYLKGQRLKSLEPKSD